MDEVLKLLPGILDFITHFHRGRGRMPTVEEMKAELESNLDKHIAIGEEWLRSHPSGAD